MDAPSFLTAQLLVSIVVILAVVHLVLGLAGYCTYFERKVSAYMQDRIGPNRVGFDLNLPALWFLKGLWGLGQPLADGLKFMLKEDYRPKGADKLLFSLGPIACVIPALIGFAVIPWGGTVWVPSFTIPLLNWHIEGQYCVIAGAPLNVGIIYLLAVGSISIYGITIAGWASNNKYSLLGALRASAQMISYEIPMGLSILTVLLMTGSLMPEAIVQHQIDHGWLILAHPLAAILFFVCVLAECNRTPFDNAECEQELVGGYHTEYGSMRWALFFLAEYSHMITAAAFFSLLFLGGYHLPLGMENHFLLTESTGIIAVLLKFHVFLAKVLAIIFLMMLVRWTIPRLKFDQIMAIAWQGMIPISLAIVVMTAAMIHFGKNSTLWMLLANVVLAGVVYFLLPFMPRATSNSRVRLAGSRYYAVEGEEVRTRPTDPLALEDRPYQGSIPA
jgi:NADH-quinone oxidoreductase subunit H